MGKRIRALLAPLSDAPERARQIRLARSIAETSVLLGLPVDLTGFDLAPIEAEWLAAAAAEDRGVSRG